MFYVPELADQGAGHPDLGLYAAKQMQRGQPKQGQTPERGVVEVEVPDDDAFLTAAGEQVSRYWHRYRLVLATNTRATSCSSAKIRPGCRPSAKRSS